MTVGVVGFLVGNSHRGKGFENGIDGMQIKIKMLSEVSMRGRTWVLSTITWPLAITSLEDLCVMVRCFGANLDCN